MITLLDNHRPGIEALCRRHHVHRLELFGSAAGGKFNDASDIDFLVEFEPLPPGEYSDHFFGLYEDLETILGRKIDLIVLQAVKNPHFLEALEQSRELLYAA
jgi:hypothetical protein